MSIVALTIGVIDGALTGSSKHALGVGLRRVILELGVLAEEGELHVAGGAVALLRDDDVGDALARGVRVVDFFAIDEQDDVCILLEAPTLARSDITGFFSRAAPRRD